MAAIDTFGPRGPSARAPIIVDGRALQFFVIATTIALLPVHWLLGTTVPWIFAATLLLAFGMVRFSLPEWQLLALGTALAASMLIAMIGHFQPGRAAAAIYNLAVLLIFVVFINFGRQTDHQAAGIDGKRPKDRIYHAALIAYLSYVAYMLIVLAYVRLTGRQAINFDSIFSSIFGGLPGIIGMYAHHVIIDTDWINGAAQSRIHGMGVYATESALHVIVLGAMAAIYLVRRRRYAWAIALELSVLPLLIPIGSRTAGLAYIASFVFLAVIWRGGLVLGAVLIGPFALGGLLVFAPDIVGGFHSFVQAVADARAGSTATRFDNYQLAISMVLDHNVLIGLGIKPANPFEPAIPIGSHSSFVSTFTRGGLIGLGLFLMFYVSMLLRVVVVQFAAMARGAVLRPEIKLELAYLARIIFVFLSWIVTEDFDVPLYTAVLVGLAIGIYWNMGERLRRVA